MRGALVASLQRDAADSRACLAVAAAAAAAARASARPSGVVPSQAWTRPQSLGVAGAMPAGAPGWCDMQREVRASSRQESEKPGKKWTWPASDARPLRAVHVRCRPKTPGTAGGGPLTGRATPLTRQRRPHLCCVGEQRRHVQRGDAAADAGRVHLPAAARLGRPGGQLLHHRHAAGAHRHVQQGGAGGAAGVERCQRVGGGGAVGGHRGQQQLRGERRNGARGDKLGAAGQALLLLP